jgi:hypothetical protein
MPTSKQGLSRHVRGLVEVFGGETRAMDTETERQTDLSRTGPSSSLPSASSPPWTYCLPLNELPRGMSGAGQGKDLTLPLVQLTKNGLQGVWGEVLSSGVHVVGGW